jgi:hypothetical protein
MFKSNENNEAKNNENNETKLYGNKIIEIIHCRDK